MDDAENQIEKFRSFHPRAVKLLEKQKNFVVVAEDEPYFKTVYDLIRNEERKKGRWTFADEEAYRDALTRIKQ